MNRISEFLEIANARPNRPDERDVVIRWGGLEHFEAPRRSLLRARHARLDRDGLTKRAAKMRAGAARFAVGSPGGGAALVTLLKDEIGRLF